MEIILVALALAIMCGAHVRLARKYDSLLNGITARTEARDVALQKQSKVNERRVAQTTRAAAKTLDAAKAALDAADHVREDTRALQGTFNTMLSDPRLQRFLNREGGEG
jgi:hypothetical protein